MVYLILAVLVFILLTVVGLVRSKPMPKDMEEAEDWLDRKLEAERKKAQEARRAIRVTVLIVPMDPTPDRPRDPWMELARREIEEITRGQG